GILTTGERSQPTLPGVEELTTPSAGIVEPAPAVEERVTEAAQAADAPYCYQCGNVMTRAGSCFACPACGATSGCS
ncbi:MAG: hypothetical protein M3144_06840, partial [Actinomycetota bacterium]|nr:hypothetical protein [Actinomycetota bacterium]